MAFSFGHLFLLGIYSEASGKTFNAFGLAQHSETKEFLVLMNECTDTPAHSQALPLAWFLEPNANGNGPRFTLQEEKFSLLNETLTPDPRIPGKKHRHFKGKEYYVYGTAVTQNGETLVIYRPSYGSYLLMARPLDMFIEHVDRPDYNYSGPRFFPI